MKKFFVFLSGMIVVASVLYITNPDQDDYHSFLLKKIKKQAETTTGVDDLFDETAFEGDFSKAIIERATKRKDYKIFSVYTTSVLGKQYHYLGIGTLFFDRTEKAEE